eukprot:TRINITY_DN14795_c0_g1_i2.p1 TRINITY_DN14795_c0_g1~~TRINITY_DN14795_c0_g1_i2.p1  ORF type:complete len:343 (+),score=21.66 TRINITY_DN14795_c0_g1_i2:83-1111(+)
MATVTPDTVRNLDKPASKYLCPLQANTYKIEFREFQVLDYNTNTLFYEVKQPATDPDHEFPEDIDPELEDMYRHVRYSFPRALLQCKNIKTQLTFSVGPNPVPNLRLIERHYFKGDLVREYDMKFGFCIPGSTNTWEAIYDMPLYSDKQVQEFVDTPEGHHSDSFYFVGDELILHNKATYSYFDEAGEDEEEEQDDGAEEEQLHACSHEASFLFIFRDPAAASSRAMYCCKWKLEQAVVGWRWRISCFTVHDVCLLLLLQGEVEVRFCSRVQTVTVSRWCGSKPARYARLPCRRQVGFCKWIGTRSLACNRAQHQKKKKKQDRKSTRLNSSHQCASRMPSSA